MTQLLLRAEGRGPQSPQPGAKQEAHSERSGTWLPRLSPPRPSPPLGAGGSERSWGLGGVCRLTEVREGGRLAAVGGLCLLTGRVHSSLLWDRSTSLGKKKGPRGSMGQVLRCVMGKVRPQCRRGQGRPGCGPDVHSYQRMAVWHHLGGPSLPYSLPVGPHPECPGAVPAEAPGFLTSQSGVPATSFSSATSFLAGIGLAAASTGDLIPHPAS